MKKDSHGMKYLISDQRPTAFEVSNINISRIFYHDLQKRNSNRIVNYPVLDDEGFVLNFHSQKIPENTHSQNGAMPTTSLADFPFDDMF